MCGIADIHVKKTPAVTDRTDLWWTCALCSALSDSVGPSGKRLQLRLACGGDGVREREKAERRGDALRSVSGFMELCITDPPPWIAIRDHSFWFYTFCCPSLPLPSPSSTPPTKVSEVSLYGHVFTRAGVLCVSARTPVNSAHQRCALTAPATFLMMPRCEAHDEDNKVERGPKHGGPGYLATEDLPSAPGNSCLNGDEWTEQWRSSSRSAHRRVDGGRVKHRRQLWCLVRL